MTRNASTPVSSWLRGHTTSSPTSSLTPNLFTSAQAIPLYLILTIYILRLLPSLLERLPPPTTSSSTSAFVVPAETRHARFLPATSSHAFRYNTLYLALRLDRLEKRRLDTGHAFAWKGGVLQPEFVDEAALAGRRSVTPAGSGGGRRGRWGEWKAKMRAAERIERVKLEEKRGRNERLTWSWTGLHPDGYLRTHIPLPTREKGRWISGSILLKLAYELRERGHLSVGPQDSDVDASGRDWRGELGHVWTVTMPSIAGITGINPLTVHYCYRPHGFPTNTIQVAAKGEDARGAFWLAVLEVHNTFSERHIYVLEAGTNEDADDTTATSKRSGYDHQWTFPRSFHVSPFNDRGGYYRLFLKEPFRGQCDTFVLGIRLLLLVESPDSDPQVKAPKLVKKLMATLDSIPPPPLLLHHPLLQKRGIQPAPTRRCVRPLTSATLYAALLRQPFDLFLTFFRILYQAAKLHFVKRLDAFGRPDMVQACETHSAQGFDGVGLPPALNRIQPHRVRATNGGGGGDGGLVYPEPGWAERVAKEYVKGVLERRVDELENEGEGWTVEVISTAPADSGLQIGRGERKLVLYTRSYGVYVDLMTYALRLALLLGSIVSRRWGVNSLDAYNSFFPHQTSTTGIRQRHFEFLLHSASHNPTQATQLLRSYDIETTPSSSGKKQGDSWRVTVALWMGYMAAVAEKKVFGWLGARYVAGTEPWLQLERGLEYIASREGQEKVVRGAKVGVGWDTRLGSVYRA
ncbi:uncharacterized protein SPSC_04779 [Sporisorium scitamineum]|uniref:Uncharacterized protein n=1 Tax=Sporisorium scitamineum TaxID=49012 RepID=A0A127ZFY5_9BASI|nr:uncharacterized protein SPSC_04779 [Sporisorium scitamineum]